MEYEFDVYESAPINWADDYTEPDCECRFSGDQADASACDRHGAYRKPVRNEHVAEPFRSLLNIVTPCSCQDGDTRTCFVHGEVA